MTIREIQAERDSQRGKHPDAQWTAMEWAALIAHYATRRAVGDLRAVDMALFRSDMVKVGALALSCIEALDGEIR